MEEGAGAEVKRARDGGKRTEERVQKPLKQRVTHDRTNGVIQKN